MRCPSRTQPVSAAFNLPPQGAAEPTQEHLGHCMCKEGKNAAAQTEDGVRSESVRSNPTDTTRGSTAGAGAEISHTRAGLS